MIVPNRFFYRGKSSATLCTETKKYNGIKCEFSHINNSVWQYYWSILYMRSFGGHFSSDRKKKRKKVYQPAKIYIICWIRKEWSNIVFSNKITYIHTSFFCKYKHTILWRAAKSISHHIIWIYWHEKTLKSLSTELKKKMFSTQKILKNMGNAWDVIDQQKNNVDAANMCLFYDSSHV